MGDHDESDPPPPYQDISREQLALTPDVPRKSILKKPATRVAKVGFDTESIEREDEKDEKITLRNKRSKSVASNRSSTQSNISRFSQVSLDPTDPAFRVLTALVVFKILFWDVASSIGDNITDFLQGFNLIFDFNKPAGNPERGWIRSWDTSRYGVLVICINWLPGIVAVIHMLAFHRSEYIVQADVPPQQHQDEPDGAFQTRIAYEKKDRISRKKRFLWSILICILAYPIVPTVMHILVIWRMNSLQDTITFSRTQQFASIARSISGCIESPIQVTITLWLIMKDIIPIPWGRSFDAGTFEDQYGNAISFPKIPVISMVFSVMNILASVIQINIMSVYIGHVKNMFGFKKFVTLAIGHLPFFLSTIIFRILGFSFILLYLDIKSLAVLIVMFLCNLLIGYTTYTTYKMPKKLKRELRRMKSIKRKEANPAEALHPSLRRQDTKKEKDKVNSPVWLNSFLSICVPCCYIHDIEHSLLDSMDDKYKEAAEKRQKVFQKKVMQYQVLSSSLILLTVIGIICYCVNTNALKHGNNRFSNLEFNIFCAVLLTMAVISLFFVKELDVFEFFGMNEEAKDENVQTIVIEKRPMSKARISKMEVAGEDEPDAGQIVINVDDGEEATVKYQEKREKKKAWGLPSKILVSIFLTALTIAPPIIGYVMTNQFPAVDPAYTFVKFNNGTLNIWITKAFIVNNPKNQSDISGKIHECYDRSSHSSEIFAIDVDELECIERISELEYDDALFNYKAIILIENWDNRSSSPYPDMVGIAPENPTQSITKLKSQSKVPILSIRKKDKKYFNDGLQNAKSSKKYYSLDISFKSLDKLLEINSHASSPLFEVDCTLNQLEGCLHFFRNPPKNGEYFLGCNGEPKKRALMNIRCKTYNKDCPELQSWERTLPSKEYEKCAVKEGSLDKKNNVYPPLTCRQKNKEFWDLGPENDLSKISCMDEANWFQGGGTCTKEGNKEIHHPQCKEATCRKWGKWSTFSKCKDVGLGFTKERYRFCLDIRTKKVKATEKCLILEKEIFKGDSLTNCNTKHKCKPPTPPV